MAATARDLGLKVNSRRDERTNYYRSTRAAALYLRDLHNEFKDWLLVLAAYNAGPAPVYRAIHRSHSRNFWALERYLPAESRQHVKRFIATAWYFDQPMPSAVDLAGERTHEGASEIPEGYERGGPWRSRPNEVLSGSVVIGQDSDRMGNSGAAGSEAGSVPAVIGAGSGAAVVGCSESVGAGFAVYSDIVKTDIREISILGEDEHYQYDNRGPGNTAGAVQPGHSISAFKEIEQCVAWNEPGAH